MNYGRIKPDTIAAIGRWVSAGIEPGGFVKAVLCNDLAGAIGRADHENMATLKEIVSYVYNEIPADAWGSPEKCEAWQGMFQ